MFMRSGQQVELRILKLTKTPLEGTVIDWKKVWERLLAREPEPGTTRLYADLTDFLRNIRHLYNPDNAEEVLDYFLSKHSLFNDNLFLFVSLFANLNNRTNHKVLTAYLKRLIELYDINQLKASNLLVMAINASRFSHTVITSELYQQLGKIVIYSLTTPNADKKDSLEQKFNTQTSSIVIKLLGNANPHSAHLLKQIFQILKNFIRPFEDSKKPLKFLYQLITGLAKRLEH